MHDSSPKFRNTISSILSIAFLPPGKYAYDLEVGKKMVSK
jgi:hypothetical protein